MTEGAATHPWAETCHLVPPGSSWGVHGPMNNCHRGSFCLGLGGGCVLGNLHARDETVKGGEELETASETPARSWPRPTYPRC